MQGPFKDSKVVRMHILHVWTTFCPLLDAFIFKRIIFKLFSMTKFWWCQWWYSLFQSPCTAAFFKTWIKRQFHCPFWAPRIVPSYRKYINKILHDIPWRYISTLVSSKSSDKVLIGSLNTSWYMRFQDNFIVPKWAPEQKLPILQVRLSTKEVNNRLSTGFNHRQLERKISIYPTFTNIRTISCP